jgi:hypothetical protein
VLSVIPDEESQAIPKGALMSVILRNASKAGTDEIIARALLPLTHLMDQKKHSFWLKFHPPTGEALETEERRETEEREERERGERGEGRERAT